jgi:hypothetical protein
MKASFHKTIRKHCILALLCGMFISPAYAQLTSIQLNASSYNNDLIAESGSNPQTVTSAALDGSGNNILYSLAFRTANSTTITSGGLPNNGTITSSGNTWQLASYSSNNALFFGPQSAVTSSTLTLTTQSPYSEISLLDAAGYGPTSVTITLKFSDGSSTNYGTFSILDWFGSTAYVVQALGRINRNTTVSNNNAPSNDPMLYQTNITLNTTDQVKKLSQIVIQDNSTNNQATAAFFAVSGIATSTLALNQVELSGQYQATTNSIDLDWNITAGVNSLDGMQYAIQRSVDGTTFLTIASMHATMSSDNTNYGYSDNSVQAGESYYYRVLEIAPSQEEAYSNIIQVQTPGSKPKFTVVPAGDLLYVNANAGSSTQAIQYAVYSIAGQEYSKGVATAGSLFTVSLHGLAHGIYFIRLQLPNTSQAVEFLR